MKASTLLAYSSVLVFLSACGDSDSLGSGSDELGSVGDAGGGGGSGMAGSDSSDGGSAGAGASGGSGATAGATGGGSGSGTAGTSGAGGVAGSSGTAGSGGTAGAAGSGGASGAAGSGGSAGAGGGTYDPCAGKTCGEACTLCAPDDTGCFETTVLKYCDAAGTCDSQQPNCGPSGGSCKSVNDCVVPTGPCQLCLDGSFACPTADCVDGQCVASFPSCGGSACMVEGEVYQSGETGVPDPTSCNSCTCQNGQLTGCTEAACPEPCPMGTESGSTCVACGPAGGCMTVLIGCLDQCRSDRDCGGQTPLCSNGVCSGLFCL